MYHGIYDMEWQCYCQWFLLIMSVPLETVNCRNDNPAVPPATTKQLTHWGRVTHTCVGKLTIIGSDNGLSPGRRQAIIWTNAGILLIGPLGTNFSDILIEILTFSFKKMHLKMSSAKWRSFCLGLNELSLPSVITYAIQKCKKTEWSVQKE